MTNIRKRITTLLLAACMLLTVLPPLGDFSQVSAEGSDDLLPSLNGFLPDIVVAENAIQDVDFTCGATSVVNKDGVNYNYLYLGLSGGGLVVYNIDTRKVVRSIILTAAPHSVHVDKDGIVWTNGGASLYRYDPVVDTGESIEIDMSKFSGKKISDIYGITSDDAGNIYFGSAPYGGLGGLTYNKTTQQWDTICYKNQLLFSTGTTGANWAGYGGVVYDNGYLYLGIDTTKEHEIIKFHIAQKEIVDWTDISDRLPNPNTKYLFNLNLVNGVLFGSCSGTLMKPVYIDIGTMEFTTLQGLEKGHIGQVSTELDGKVYFYANKKYNEYDVQHHTITNTYEPETIPALRLSYGNIVTINGEKNLIVPFNDTNNITIDLYFYNLDSKEYTIVDDAVTDGVAYSLRAPALDPTSKYVYVAAANSSLVSQYGVDEGYVVKTFPTYNMQTDGLLYHEGYLYAGNYSSGTITKVDPDTYEATPLFSLRDTAFNQTRMWALAAGGNKVFVGTFPETGFGGVLAWYDSDAKRTYVAAGETENDVYYLADADTNNWYNLKGEKMDFDYNKDLDHTKADALDGNLRRFKGLIPNQIITNLVYYKDRNGGEYLYGTTCIDGKSGSTVYHEMENAKLFVYDLNTMEVIGTHDLTQDDGDQDTNDIFRHLTNTTNDKYVETIDQLAQDPDVPGKFWGVVSDTLFSFTFDASTGKFDITNVYSSLQQYAHYSLPGHAAAHRNIIFDNEYMYVSFTRDNGRGTYIILKDNPNIKKQISDISPNQMVLAADGNLYWTTNEGFGKDHLHMFPLAQYRNNYATVTHPDGKVSFCSTEETLADALSVSGNKVTLLKDVEVSEATMATGVVLDLNGCKLSGDIITDFGTVTDSTDGDGMIQQKPMANSIEPGQVALKDGSGYRVVNYTVTIDSQSVVRGNDVHFWYRVAFTNPDAYRWVENSPSDFELGIRVTLDDDRSADAKFDSSFVQYWAAEMLMDTTNSTYLHICLLNGAQRSMSLTPMVNSKLHNSSIAYKAQSYSFELTFPGDAETLTGNVILTTHDFE